MRMPMRLILFLYIELNQPKTPLSLSYLFILWLSSVLSQPLGNPLHYIVTTSAHFSLELTACRKLWILFRYSTFYFSCMRLIKSSYFWCVLKGCSHIWQWPLYWTQFFSTKSSPYKWKYIFLKIKTSSTYYKLDWASANYYRIWPGALSWRFRWRLACFPIP